MPRIFAGLAISQIIVTLGTAALGLACLDGGPDRHILLAVFTIVLSCFIQVVAFTYLTVTGKMITQAVHLGGMDHGPVMEVKRLKRSFTHLLAVLLVAWLLTAGSGGHLWRVEGNTTLHLAAGCLIMAAHLFVYYRQFGLILANAALVDRTLAAYRHRKSEACMQGGADRMPAERS